MLRPRVVIDVCAAAPEAKAEECDRNGGRKFTNGGINTVVIERLHLPLIGFQSYGQHTLANGVDSGDLYGVGRAPGKPSEGGSLDLRRGCHCRGRDTWPGDAGLVSR